MGIRTRVDVTGEGVDEGVLLDVRRWLEHHSPVGGTFRYEVPVTVEIGSGGTTGT